MGNQSEGRLLCVVWRGMDTGLTVLMWWGPFRPKKQHVMVGVYTTCAFHGNEAEG